MGVAPGRARGLRSGLAAVLLHAAMAAAQPVTDGDVPHDLERPWAQGVSPERRSQALRIFEEGNQLFEQSLHARALARYRAAIAIWDHPAIRYNIAVCLIHLDQPLQAHENLILALRHGAAPLEAESYVQALTYRKLLLGQLGQLRVSCAEPGAEVTLDGERLFFAPGEASRMLLPGAHQLVARKAGHLTESRSLMVLPAVPTDLELRLVPLGALTRTERRWAVWKPWLVVAAGAVVALVGTPLYADAASGFQAYDREVAARCATGCQGGSPELALARDARTRAQVEYGMAVGTFAAGGALALSGLVMIILNQPRLVEARPLALGVAPVLGMGMAGLGVAGSF